MPDNTVKQRRARRLGVLAGAAVAVAGIAISLVGGLIATRRQARS